MKEKLLYAFAVLFLCGCGDFKVKNHELLPDEIIDNPPIVDSNKEPIQTLPVLINTLGSPETDPNFLQLSNGINISNLKVNGQSLYFVKGSGTNFNSTVQSRYLTLKNETLSNPTHKVQWAFMNLDSGNIIYKSLSSDKRIFGASSSKIYVAATLLDLKEGHISSNQLQLMANMIVVSSNTAWTELQRQIGDGSADKGRELNYIFTQKMGYKETRGFQGYWGDLHGNELTPEETVKTLFDTYHNNYPGADILWKLMYTGRTGASRGKKYIPSNIYVGGKTGTYSGPTENPETGNQYTVDIRNHVLTFNINSTQYGLVIFANDGQDESVALLAGGLIREYISF